MTPKSPILFAVVTWNMHAGRGDLSRLVDDLASGTLAGAPVHEYALLLQEATATGINNVFSVARTRNLFAASTHVLDVSRRTSGNAILTTRPLAGTHGIELPRERQPRDALVTHVDIGSERLFLVSAHLENRITWLRGALFSDTARGRQANALLSALPPHRHGIVGGDMNTWLGPIEPAWRALVARFPDTPAARPDPTFHRRLVLDHLFFDLPEGWIATRQVVRERYGSDHHPVLGLVLDPP